MAAHSGIFARKSHALRESGGLQSMDIKRVRNDLQLKQQKQDINQATAQVYN